MSQLLLIFFYATFKARTNSLCFSLVLKTLATRASLSIEEASTFFERGGGSAGIMVHPFKKISG